jgi:hypothetical protein
MGKVIRDVSNLNNDDRQALERVVGKPLRDGAQLIIDVVETDVQPKPPMAGSAHGDSQSQIPEWWKVYEGLSDEEIDHLDEAIRKRADLTRTFE